MCIRGWDLGSSVSGPHHTSPHVLNLHAAQDDQSLLQVLSPTLNPRPNSVLQAPRPLEKPHLFQTCHPVVLEHVVSPPKVTQKDTLSKGQPFRFEDA